MSAHRHSPPARALRLCLSLCLLLPPVVSCSTTTPAYHIEISKSRRSLQLKQENLVVKEYFIAHGQGGAGTKRRLGDGKTPLGHYRVAEFREKSKFHFFILLNYPNLLDAWYGYQNEVIDGADFRNIAAAARQRRAPPQSTGLGGYIGIHGIGETTRHKLDIHRAVNWTEGCIALRNDEIMELKELVTIGTPVIITE